MARAGSRPPDESHALTAPSASRGGHALSVPLCSESRICPELDLGSSNSTVDARLPCGSRTENNRARPVMHLALLVPAQCPCRSPSSISNAVLSSGRIDQPSGDVKPGAMDGHDTAWRTRAQGNCFSIAPRRSLFDPFHPEASFHTSPAVRPCTSIAVPTDSTIGSVVPAAASGQSNAINIRRMKPGRDTSSLEARQFATAPRGDRPDVASAGATASAQISATAADTMSTSGGPSRVTVSHSFTEATSHFGSVIWSRWLPRHSAPSAIAWI